MSNLAEDDRLTLVDGAVQFIPLNPRERILAEKLNGLFNRAAEEGAADIHIESVADGSLVVRMRNRDGDLIEVAHFPDSEATLVFNKIRYRSNLSVVDTRAPQDSRITQKVGDRSLSVRVSIVPTIHGSTCVMRLLDPANSGKPIESLRMPERVERAFRAAIRSPEGLVLTVGPTGSGKTTTLYTALGMRNEPSIKIVTAEDPVEYLLNGAQQVEVGVNRGITFAQALRAFLRQDPDIILVGEIRDSETIQTALQAGQTGHLVLSTLHANNPIEAIDRMMELGAKPQTLRSALRCVIAQRLVRLVCQDCAQKRQITDPEALAVIEQSGVACTHESVGVGCDKCGGTGYSGRQAIYEMLVMDKPARVALMQGKLDALEQAASHQRQYAKLLVAAMGLVQQGRTNMQEVQRVVVEI
jgi:type II secretory ATPase GspE/PulE/Tfp pilus assembly ATPase PilB-like protein